MAGRGIALALLAVAVLSLALQVAAVPSVARPVDASTGSLEVAARRAPELQLTRKLASTKVSAQIVNGEDAPRQRYPWIVRYNPPGCGGSLIAPDIVMTAAHCISDATMFGGTIIPADDLPKDIKIGVYDLKDTDGSFERRAAVAGVIHENYNRLPGGKMVEMVDGEFDGRNDIALLLLDKPSTKKPISMGAYSAQANVANRTDLIAIGWGKICGGKTCPDTQTLKQVTLPFIPDVECKKYFEDPKNTGKEIITKSMICAGSPRFSPNDTCQGDSGGPLLWRDPNDAEQGDVQIGVVSWGRGCGESQPGVYTDVGYMVPWTNRHIKELRAGKYNPKRGCKSRFVSTPKIPGSKGMLIAANEEMDEDELNTYILHPYCNELLKGAGYAGSYRLISIPEAHQGKAYGLAAMNALHVINSTFPKTITLGADSVVLGAVECVPRGHSPCKADKDGNVGSRNVGRNNYGRNNRGSANFGSNNAGSSNVGDNNDGSLNVGSGNRGSGNWGSRNTKSNFRGTANVAAP